MKSLFLLILLSLMPFAAATADLTGVVVVRHAEKADDGTPDPPLAPEGRTRARALADALDRGTVAGLIASQYQRTRQTLAVLAERHGLDITVIPAESGEIDAHVDAVVSAVRASDAEGILVIAGHSNTVPMIVEKLTGRAVSPIPESEYDRLYLLLPGESGLQIITTRYGEPSAESNH